MKKQKAWGAPSSHKEQKGRSPLPIHNPSGLQDLTLLRPFAISTTFGFEGLATLFFGFDVEDASVVDGADVFLA